MRVPLDIESEQVRDGLLASGLVELSLAAQPPQRLHGLDPEQMRGVQLARLLDEQAPGEVSTPPGLKDDLDRYRGVDDDHRSRRSAAISSAADISSSTGCRRRSRS